MISSISSIFLTSSSREPRADARHHRAQIAVADVVVVNVLLGDHQMVLPLVLLRLFLAHIAFLDQIVDLICGVGGEIPTKLENSLTVGRPSAMMISMQKVSTVVRACLPLRKLSKKQKNRSDKSEA